MIIRCSNEACNTQLRLNTDGLKTGKTYSSRCPKCNVITPFEVPADANPSLNLASAQPVKQPVSQNKTVVLDRDDNQPAVTSEQIGWLVVHDEHTAQQTFPLKVGRNVIGRKSLSKTCDIMIETNDAFMSRQHSVIDVLHYADGRFAYILSDCGSANGTFVNADQSRKLSQHDQIYLKDGDTVQLGKTKLVLKMGNGTKTETEASQEVVKSAFQKTVIA
jgi:pSer/pThr/pTyr-binding forkhead associated (FHA) protein